MTAYTDIMVETLQAQEIWTYDEACEFASKHGLSNRSVISKIKSLGIDYEPKARPAAAAVVVRKSDIVANIATLAGVNFDAIEGLGKADKASLVALRDALRPTEAQMAASLAEALAS